jgi:hypothetical protein
MPVGSCKLCQRPNVVLCLSHYIPKAAFRAVNEIGNARPLIIKNGIAIQKDDQITAHILCRECEQRLSENGEKWMLKYANRADGFKLYELVTSIKPDNNQNGLGMYNTSSVEEIDAAKITYFISSILWRGSVLQWRWGKDPVDSPSLGKKYEEEFRQYLLGISDFPQNAVVMVALISDPKWRGSVDIPKRKRLQDGVWGFKTTILGISFNVFIGNSLNQATRNACLYRSAQKYIFAGPMNDAWLVQGYYPTLAKARTIVKKEL